MTPRRLMVILGTAAAVIALDQATKAVVRDRLPPGGVWPDGDGGLSRLFTFTHVQNTGIAFGMLQGNNGVMLLVAGLVVVGLALYRRSLGRVPLLLDVALGLVIAGALGNAIDRVVVGHVTDFLDFKVWPVFNVADTSISTGVTLLVWHMWRSEREAERAARAPTPT